MPAPCATPLACLPHRTLLGCDTYCYELNSKGRAACNSAYKVAAGIQSPHGARACYWEHGRCKWSRRLLTCAGGL